MAVIAPMILKQQAFAAKVETTTGTAASLAAADCDVLVYADQDAITLDTKFNQRPGQGSSAQHEGVPGEQVGAPKFSIELVGSGTAATSPTWEKYLLSAGFAVSNNVSGSNTAYTPITGSSSMVSLTEGHYIDGMLYQLRGVTHDAVFKGDAGNPVKIEFTGKGGWVDPTATAMISVTNVVNVPIPPRFVSSTFTIGGTAYIIKGFELALNNVVSVRLDGGSPNGVHSTCVADRNITLQMDVEADTTKIWPTTYTAGATAAASLTVGSVAGNTWTFSVPKAQLMEPPSKIDLDGVLGYRLKFQAVRNTLAGDDELTITQS